MLTSSLGSFAEVPKDLKSFLKKEFKDIEFRIDDSFTTKKELYIPLIPEETKIVKKIDYIFSIPKKTNLPKFFLLNNGWAFAKVINEKTGTKTILDVNEIPEKYRDQILSNSLPKDLVIPNTKASKIKLNGLLYLTSPDSGKIIYLDLARPEDIKKIETDGTPWEIIFNENEKLFFVTDLSRDKIYQLTPKEQSIHKIFQLENMLGPTDIKLSNNGSTAYILESLGNRLAKYKIDAGKNKKDEILKPILKLELPPNPKHFIPLEESNLIAVTCPTTKNLILINRDSFELTHKVTLEYNPGKLVYDKKNNSIYIVNRNSNSISKYDLSSKKIISLIEVGDTPTSITVNPKTRFLYVANGKSNSISIVNLETDTIIDTITLPIETQFPGDIEITPDGNYLIVGSETTGTVSIIDLLKKEIIAKIDVGDTTHAVYFIVKE